MNLFLHGIGPDDDDRRAADRAPTTRCATSRATHADVVLTNPPFGKKSRITVVNEEGETDKQSAHLQPPRLLDDDLEQAAQLRPAREVACSRSTAAPRSSCPTTCSSRAAPARPSAGSSCTSATSTRCCGCRRASSTPRASRRTCSSSTASPAARSRGRKTVWVYDLRTNKHFTLKENRLTRADLDEFVACYRPGERHEAQGDLVREDARRPLAPVQLRRDPGPRQGQPRPLLAARREPGGLRQPARPARPRRRRSPTTCAPRWSRSRASSGTSRRG